MSQSIKINFTINGKRTELTIPPYMLLIDLIREELGLKGTKPGCLEGECGACTVLVNGEAVNSCLYLAINVDGKEVITVEGLPVTPEGEIDPVQEALIQHGAVQCGFCTPGMVMSIKSFVAQCNKDNIIPSPDEIKKAIEGNLCRCTGYVKIVEAVESLF
ncbi:(2Fe-2S)-binding protein [bacterium]|nr:(2Fe-2S)-binding protein [bacterium]